MNAAVPLVLALTLPGCLTTGTQSSAIERSSTGLETLSDPEGEHLLVEELGSGEGLVELVVFTAKRELEVETFELSEVTTEARGWKQGGRAGRNALWLASAAAGWVGAFGVSWETGDGREIQIGGLGADAQSWQGVTSLVAALSGIGAGAQQTVAVHRPGSSSSSVLGSERVLLGSKSVALAPLVGQALELGLGEGSLLSAATDAGGRASVSGLQLPTSSWAEGLGLTSGGLRGTWTPSGDLRDGLLALPAEWSSPFHASMLDDVADLAKQAAQGGGGGDLQLADLTSPNGARARLEALPVEEQVPLAQAWLEQLEPYAEAAAAQRERVNLDVLRSSASMARQMVAGQGAFMVQHDQPLGDIIPLFEPYAWFGQLPDEALVTVEAVGRPVFGSQDSRVVLLEAGPCVVSDERGAQPAGRAIVVCGATRVIVASDQDLHLADGHAWVVAGLLDAPIGVRQLGVEGSGWLPVIRPLYAANLAVDAAGEVSFTQVLDEEGVLESGVLRRVGE